MVKSKLELLLTADVKDFLGKMGGATAALGALTAAASAIQASVQDWQDWGKEVHLVAAELDTTTEDASVFVRLMQDYDVTLADLKRTHKALVKEGIEPTIVAMATNIDKITLSTRELSDYAEAVDKLTEGEAQQVKDQTEAVNAMRAAWQQLSRSFASEIAPAVTTALNWIADAFIVTESEAMQAELKSLEAGRRMAVSRGMSTEVIDQQIMSLRALIEVKEYEAAMATYYARQSAEEEANNAALTDSYYDLTEAIWGKSKAQIMEIAATEGLGSEAFQSAYATYLHRRSVMDALDTQLFPKETRGGGGGSRSPRETSMRTVEGEDMGMVVSNALVANQEMLAELIRLFENLPVVLKDLSERS